MWVSPHRIRSDVVSRPITGFGKDEDETEDEDEEDPEED